MYVLEDVTEYIIQEYKSRATIHNAIPDQNSKIGIWNVPRNAEEFLLFRTCFRIPYLFQTSQNEDFIKDFLM